VRQVAFGLPCLGEQDQWRRVRRLSREREVEQDEGIWIPVAHERGRVEHDPHDHHEALRQDVLGGAEEACRFLGRPTKPVGSERAVALLGHTTSVGDAQDSASLLPGERLSNERVLGECCNGDYSVPRNPNLVVDLEVRIRIRAVAASKRFQFGRHLSRRLDRPEDLVAGRELESETCHGGRA
jgi:hypothetical protein